MIHLSLSDNEKAEIEALIKDPLNDIPAVRLRIVLLSAQDVGAPDISKLVDLHSINVRKWLHRYQRSGLDGLRSNVSPGRPPAYSAAQRNALCKLYAKSPQVAGLNSKRWSLARLRDYAIACGLVESISIETVRQIVSGNRETVFADDDKRNGAK